MTGEFQVALDFFRTTAPTSGGRFLESGWSLARLANNPFPNVNEFAERANSRL
jgi:hypothetical protein